MRDRSEHRLPGAGMTLGPPGPVLALAAIFAGIGFLALLSGLGLVWPLRPETAKEPKRVTIPAPMPA